MADRLTDDTGPVWHALLRHCEPDPQRGPGAVPADGDAMRRATVPRDDRLPGAEMLERVALMATSVAGLTFGWFAWRRRQGAALDIARTETFTVQAMRQART